ncbi:hypothetical protein BT96DRAFT_654253 [Gymnopus androsaceus JB14]|uniref:Uncharacterized protein n=1 Tax=Gymnopus androsaceus JB14 TaxID=1447944 RepID=A0A6A4GFR4_9AGAR|nr:hypothetical protein BT96DRAFT_654253 [Gymnopus androsaceus JB14]
MSSPNIPPVTALSGPYKLFSGAHDFQISRSNFQVASGDIYNQTPVCSSYLWLHELTEHYNPQIVYYCKWRLSSAPPNYYIVGCIKPGSPGETSHIVRRFTREEDRDRFESLLKKFGWSSFTSKALWKLTVNGDPCLAVSSAGDFVF